MPHAPGADRTGNAAGELLSVLTAPAGANLHDAQPSLTWPALRQAVAAVAPTRLPEMYAKMQEAFVRAGEEGSVTPIHMFHREWAVIVEIERHPDIASRLHAAEQAPA